MRKYHYPLYDAVTQDDAGTLKITAENVEEADEKAFTWQRTNAGYDVDILRARAEIMPVTKLGEVEL